MKYVRVLTILFLLFVVYIIWAADNKALPAGIYELYHYPNGDKIGHFFLLGILTFLINCSLPDKSIKLVSLFIPLGTLLVTILSILEEISQTFFPARTFSLLDMGTSLLGVAFFSLLSTFFIKYFPKN